jgi:hypothetical protein
VAILQFSVLKHRTLALAVAAVLAVAACGTGSQAGQSDTAGGMTIDVVEPADGSDVSIPFAVQIEASVPLGEPESGNHHVHLYFDTDTRSAEYDIVYGNTAEVTRQLEPGDHVVIAALANPDHSLAGPTHEIAVTVGDGAGGETAPAPSATEPGIEY